MPPRNGQSKSGTAVMARSNASGMQAYGTRQKIAQLLAVETQDYRPTMAIGTAAWGSPAGWGFFSLNIVDEMRRDYSVRQALRFVDAPLHKAEFEITADSPEVGEFVETNLRRFWQKSLTAALECLPYGFAASEVIYKAENGQINFDTLRIIHPRDARPYTLDGKLAYVKVTHANDVWAGMTMAGAVVPSTEGQDAGVVLRAAKQDTPAKGVWWVYSGTNPYNEWYGSSILMPCWWPWRLKSMPDGAMENLAKAFYRHAYNGMIMRYPNEMYQDETMPAPVHAKDFVAQLGEQLKTGGNISLSSERYEDGELKYFIEKYGGEVPGDFSQLIGYIDRLDTWITRGIGVPDEILAHEGNGLPLDAPVLTPTGWVPIGSLTVGDKIADPNGTDSEVTGVYPQGVRPTYRITFSDGSTVIADEEHRWKVHHETSKGATRVLTTKEMIAERKKGYQLFLPQVEPVMVQARGFLPIDPYLVGMLIGDGGMTHCQVRFTSADKELVDSFKELVPAGAEVKQGPGLGYDYTLTSSKDPGGRKHGLMRAVRKLGMDKLSYEKSIPEMYLWASVSDRIALLQGLMDTDGSVDTAGIAEYCSSSIKLIEQVQYLVQSLGGKTVISVRETLPGKMLPQGRALKTARPHYRLRSIKFPVESGINPFRLKRKAERYEKYRATRICARNGWGIKSIEPCGQTETVCISVSAPSCLYFTEHFIPTHNTGGYSRSEVSLNSFFLMEEEILNTTCERFVDQVLRPLVNLIYGPVEFDVKPKSLLPDEEQDTDVMAGGEEPGKGVDIKHGEPYYGPKGGVGERDPRTGRVEYGKGPMASGKLRQKGRSMSLDMSRGLESDRCGYAAIFSPRLGKLKVWQPPSRNFSTTGIEMSAGPHSYSSTQFDLPEAVAKKIRAIGENMPSGELAKEGIEKQPHITIKYGIHRNDSQQLRELLKDFGPVKVTLGSTSCFGGDLGYDVLKVEVYGTDLFRLNRLIAESVANTESFPTYKPHITICYLKQGKGNGHVGNNSLDGLTMTFDALTFSPAEGEPVQIPLCGAREMSANESVKLKVKIIDGRAFRESARKNLEFGSWGVHADFSDIPDGWIYIDSVTDPIDRAYFIVNAKRYIRAMKEGRSKDEAYDEGLMAERAERELKTHGGRGDRPYHDEVPDGVYKHLYRTINQDGETIYVWAVNGRTVREIFKTDGVEGYHGYVYPWVPENEIWLSDLNPDEMPFVLVHESDERRSMKHLKMGYDDAHKAANKAEWAARMAAKKEMAEMSLETGAREEGKSWSPHLEKVQRDVEKGVISGYARLGHSGPHIEKYAKEQAKKSAEDHHKAWSENADSSIKHGWVGDFVDPATHVDPVTKLPSPSPEQVHNRHLTQWMLHKKGYRMRSEGELEKGAGVYKWPIEKIPGNPSFHKRMGDYHEMMSQRHSSGHYPGLAAHLGSTDEALAKKHAATATWHRQQDVRTVHMSDDPPPDCLLPIARAFHRWKETA